MATEIGKLDVDRFGQTDAEQSSAKIKADVKIIPAKRTATYAMPTASGAELVARVNVKGIVLSSSRSAGGLSLEKTMADVSAAITLLEAVRAELIEQGVTE